MSHTEGPWRLNAGNETEIMSADGRLNVARAHCGGMSGIKLAEAEANARLIAAAPELLEALQASVGRLMNAKFDLESGDSKATVIGRLADYIRLTDAAIAKARGAA